MISQYQYLARENRKLFLLQVFSKNLAKKISIQIVLLLLM